MTFLLKCIGRGEEYNVEKEISRDFGDPDARPVEEVSQYHVYKDRKGHKEQNHSGQCGADCIYSLNLAIKRNHYTFIHEKSLHA